MSDAVHRKLKAAYPRTLATLIRLLGGFEAAEDALQDAVTRALEVWPVRGVPDHPAAWLVTTARRRHIDVVRRRRLEERYADLPPQATIDDEWSPERQMGRRLYDDDMMRLVFTCCHPALGVDARVALALRAVAGLTVEEIARASLVTLRVARPAGPLSLGRRYYRRGTRARGEGSAPWSTGPLPDTGRDRGASLRGREARRH